MATRNRFFRVAMLALTSSYLLVAARNLVDVVQSFQDHLDGGFKIAFMVASVAFVVQACGFAVLAAAFGPTMDRRLLRIGGAVVASAFVAYLVSTLVFLIPVFNDPRSADHRAIYVWVSVSTGLAAIAVVVIAAGLLRSRRGPDLAPALRIGLVFGALSAGAAATAGFHEWSLYTAQNYVPELTVGTLIVAITQIVVALFLVALAFGIRLPLPRREKWLTAAAAGVATATFAGVVGRALVAIAYGHKGSTSDDLVDWLLVGSGLLAFTAYAAIALGARSAVAAIADSGTAAARPLARRNLDFWIAALVAAAAYLVLAGRYVLEAAHRLGLGLSFGVDAADVLNVVAALVGALGWVVVATAFDLEIDWRRLRLGAALVAAAYVGNYAAWTIEVLDIPNDHGAFHQYLIWSAIGAFFLAGGALVVLSGLGESKRGRARGLRLQVGLAMAAASAGAFAVAAFQLHAFQQAQPNFSQESTIGSLATAIAQVGVAFAVLFFALEAGAPLRRREGMLTSTAALGAVATLCVAAGQAALAVGYSTHAGAAWVAIYAWLIAAFPLVFGIAIGLVAVGARSARDEDVPATSAAADQLAPEPA